MSAAMEEIRKMQEEITQMEKEAASLESKKIPPNI